MRVDLHFHFCLKKSDRFERLKNMVKEAEKAGIQGIALLDHNWFPTDEVMHLARKAAPSIVFWRACELDVKGDSRAIKEHVVVVSDDGLPFDVSSGISAKEVRRLAEACRRGDVLTMLAHPFRRMDSICFEFVDFRPDLIDFVGRSSNPLAEEKVIAISKQYGIRLASASDSHKVSQVGRHSIDLDDDVKDVGGLVKAIRSGKYSLSAENRKIKKEAP